MDVASVNDGPVTVLLDTREPKPASSSASSSALATPNASSVNLAATPSDAAPLPISKKQAKWNAKQLEKANAANGGADSQSVGQLETSLAGVSLLSVDGTETPREQSSHTST